MLEDLYIKSVNTVKVDTENGLKSQLAYGRQAGLPWIWVSMDISMDIMVAHLLIKLNTFHPVYHPSQHSYFISFLRSPPLCRRHSDLSLFPPT